MLRKTFIVIVVELLSDFSVNLKYFVLVTFLIAWMSFEAWIEPYKHEGFSMVVAYV